MERENVVKRVKNYISFVTTIDAKKLGNDKSLRNDYKLDCFELYEIFTGLEDRFDTQIILKCHEEPKTINEIVDIILENKM